MRAFAAAIVMVCALGCGCGRRGFDVSGARSDAIDDTGDRSDGDGPPAASCESSPATCGPMGNAVCCESPVVGDGMFLLAYDVAGDGLYMDMSRSATLSSFRLDRFEVTVGRFRVFVDAGLGTTVNPPTAGAGGRTLNGIANQGGWDPTWNASLTSDTAELLAGVKCSGLFQTWTDTPGTQENRPINCITWYEAMAFCAWDGGFLPTQVELMYVAGGGSQQRAYPWSNPAGSTAIDCTLANYDACGVATSNVGSRSPAGDGVWGHADLAGNVFEWALDYFSTPLPVSCDDCADLTSGGFRAIRGGGFANPPSNQRSANRSFMTPASRSSEVGVRCARRP